MTPIRRFFLASVFGMALMLLAVALESAKAAGLVCVDWNGEVLCSEIGPQDPQTFAIEVCGIGQQGRLSFYTRAKDGSILTYGPIYFQAFRTAPDGSPIYVTTDNVIGLDGMEDCNVIALKQAAPTTP